MTGGGPPSLAFITPVFPASSGIGTALRMQVFLDAFAADFRVHLIVVPLIGLPPGDDQLAALSAQCASVDVVSPYPFEDPGFAAIARAAKTPERDEALAAYPFPQLGRFSRKPLAGAVAATQRGRPIAIVHIARLYLAPLAAEWAGRQPRPLLQLDLDDHESRTHASLAGVLERRGQAGQARVERAEGGKYRWWEDSFLPRFDRVLVCS